MRLTGACLAALCLLVIIAPADAARPHRSMHSCPQTPSHPLLADRVATVYEATESLGLHVSIFACARGARHIYDLGPSPQCGGGGGGCESVENVALAGTVVAYERTSATGALQTHAGAEYSIVVRELRTGRTLEKVPTGTNSVLAESAGSGPATALVVKSDGAVAWIVQKNVHEGKYQVHALDRSGARVLAVGPDIDPGSLALAGSTLYWTQGGKPFSTTLN
jgi:hypothetical protein